jgi:hypothetical protein
MEVVAEEAQMETEESQFMAAEAAAAQMEILLLPQTTPELRCLVGLVVMQLEHQADQMEPRPGAAVAQPKAEQKVEMALGVRQEFGGLHNESLRNHRKWFSH